jgi:hypothetical protein
MNDLLPACIVHKDVEAAELRCRIPNAPSATGNIRYIHVDHRPALLLLLHADPHSLQGIFQFEI